VVGSTAVHTPRAGRGCTGTAEQAGAGLAHRASAGARGSTALRAAAEPEATRRVQRCRVLGPRLRLVGSVHAAHAQLVLHKLRLVPLGCSGCLGWGPCSKDPGPVPLTCCPCTLSKAALRVTGAARVALVPTVSSIGRQELRARPASCKTGRQVRALASSAGHGRSPAALAAAKRGICVCQAQADSGERGKPVDAGARHLAGASPWSVFPRAPEACLVVHWPRSPLQGPDRVRLHSRRQQLCTLHVREARHASSRPRGELCPVAAGAGSSGKDLAPAGCQGAPREAEQAGVVCARRARLSKHAQGTGTLRGCRSASAPAAQPGQTDVLAQVLAERVRCRGAPPVRCIMVTWQLTMLRELLPAGVATEAGENLATVVSSIICDDTNHTWSGPRLTPIVSATTAMQHAVCGVHIGCSSSRCVCLYACLHVTAMRCTCALSLLGCNMVACMLLAQCHSMHGTLAPAALASLLLLACLAHIFYSPPCPYIAVQTASLQPFNVLGQC